MRKELSTMAVVVTLGASLGVIAGCCCSVPAGGGGYTPQPSPYISNATDATFNDVVLSSDLPVVVDFWASWCGPCAMIDPTVVKLAEEFQGRVQFVRVNVDDSPHSANRYNANSIPMLALYHEGELLDTKVGVQSDGTLRQWLLGKLSKLEARAGES